ncbi:hypothetical protein HCN44_004653 [Aphidius gifuensis]|uniref:BTB domain-containing protein n=1 Tax=Aphidius gifuensis TaxID=684658 RepID=A0A834XZL5_APHGI|nr:hypothetical protein HCN44_004653 [Aphidius gifuensis]
MDNEQPHQELVKCVVVGDTAVGKTRLICARACNKHVSLSQLLTTAHVPTVFASDVVLLCFSITNPISLRNCKAMWYQEIRKFCPQTPVLLVGCKNDLRFMYRDETYLRYFRDRSPFIRATKKCDLVMPDQAREVARELGIHYYEASVFTYYGVNEIFENAIRAALIARRQQRFWIQNLKKVQRPLMQTPFCPPKPIAPVVCLTPSTYDDNMKSLWTRPVHTDVAFIVGTCTFTAHRCLLSAASPTFQRLFSMELTHELTPRSSSESSMASTFGEATVGDFNDDTECLIRIDQSKPTKVWDQLKRRSSFQVLPTADQRKAIGAPRELNHPAFQNIRIALTENSNGAQQSTTVVTLSKLVTPQAMQQCLQFIYTGNLDKRYHILQTAPIGLLLEIRQAAEFLELPQLLMVLGSIQARSQFINSELNNQYKQVVRERLEDICLDQGLFGDVLFELDDGTLPAHRAILTARCDMMKAMFSGDFRESSAKVIVFPGVREYTFHKLLCYIYTDEVPVISSARCLNLLELANRLCLPRLINLVESRVVQDLERVSQNDTNEAIESCLRLLEPSKFHNADQLANWCMNYLCINYDNLCKISPKSVKLLHPENQDYLSEHRWPPVWYLKDYDYYQKYIAEHPEAKPNLKRNRNQSGCLCFSSTNKTRKSDIVTTSANDTTADRPLFDGSIESGESV